MKRDRSRERLWTLEKDGARRYAELCDCTEHGWEFQMFADNGFFVYGESFETRDQAMQLSDLELNQRLRDRWTLVEAADDSNEPRS